MRIQLTWPNAADTCLTLTIPLPDVTTGSSRPALRRIVGYAGPVLAAAADAAGAGLLARLALPLAVHFVEQALDSPVRDPHGGPARPPVPVGAPA
ncbi:MULTISPECIES: hypothetical protein [Streptomyces]|uniref:Uncharacterized protein n=1 Tax=Streptomyces morookaense TaxID=1970 RepID=A0A7Y7B848_STRMO|nr:MULTISPECIES: hypothetical protein [Streptomyces]MCC2280377.1 hypothetical protein [Streptomyces sp. ET3-23]NVK80604.1 hypothetical protein [Streptomyces morookaense]GHF54097.1 hypothetical protein GCM10010359_65620 [Streptomyces morookaense]